MVNAYDVPASELIDAVAKELKNNEKIKPPEWIIYAKSGTHKERPTQGSEFWYLRGASMLRKIYMKGSLGTQRLRAEYGGKKNRGAKPEEHRKAGGAIIRKLLQQLDTAGYVKKGKKGREITPAGQKFLDNTAFTLYKKPKTQEEKVVAVKEKAMEMAEKLPEEKKGKLKIAEKKVEGGKVEGSKKEEKPAKKEEPKTEGAKAGKPESTKQEPKAEKKEAKPKKSKKK